MRHRTGSAKAANVAAHYGNAIVFGVCVCACVCVHTFVFLPPLAIASNKNKKFATPSTLNKNYMQQMRFSNAKAYEERNERS